MQRTPTPHTPHTPASRRSRGTAVLAVFAAAAIAAACGPATGDVAAAGSQEDSEVEGPIDETASPDDATSDADGSVDPDEGSTSTGGIDAADREPPSEDEGDDQTTTLTVGFDEQTVTVFATDGSELLGYGLPDERLEQVADVVVRPGATTTELDAVVVVLRGEVYRLYHLGVTDGRDGAFLAFPEHLQPQDVTEAVMTVTWTPDADSLVWTEPTGDGVVLRSVGWDDGPGTDRPADDNATFVLDLPADVSIDGFEVVSDHRWTVRMTDGMGTSHEVVMERQPDGALALPS